MSELITLDPAPEEWLTSERLEDLQVQLGASVPLLIRADALRTVLNCWIRGELGVDEDAMLAWAHAQWGHRLDSLFLQRKDRLDQASCRLLRVKQQGLALELYHRLLAEEATFEQVSQEFGVGSERFQGGLLKQQGLASFPGNLGQLLRKLKPGQLSKPLQVGKLFAIVKLENFVSAVHGDSSTQLLLELELDQWVEGMVSHLEALVSSTD